MEGFLSKIKLFVSKASITSEAIQNSQNALLLCPPYNTRVHFEQKKSSNGMNYVIATRKSDNIDTTSGRKLIANSINVSANTTVNDDKNKSRGTLLLLHGYGAGLGMFFQNYDVFLNDYDRVVAVDWLGMGGSARKTAHQTTAKSSEISDNMQQTREYTPKVPLTDIGRALLTGRDDYGEDKQVESAEAYFCDSLHELVKEIKHADAANAEVKTNRPMDIASHSLGSYLAFRYLQRYCSDADGMIREGGPVRGLILISPCGLPNHPPQDKQLTFSEVAPGFKLVRMLWKSNFTPQNMVRIPYWGSPEMIANSLNRRFRGRWQKQKEGNADTVENIETELQCMSNYLYHITVAPASGEFALNSLLTTHLYYDDVLKESDHTMTGGDNNGKKRGGFGTGSRASSNGSTASQPTINETSQKTQIRGGIYAKKPIEDDIKKYLRLPLLLLYGDTDWMAFDDVKGKCSDWQDAGVRVQYEEISGAGHHVYLDNTTDFHAAVHQWIAQM